MDPLWGKEKMNGERPMLNPRYKRLEIEWKHFAVGDATCERCGNTGEALTATVEELRREFAPAGVKINLTETTSRQDTDRGIERDPDERDD